MLIPVLLFAVGLVCLIKGGDWFVDGATGIARKFHVPELLIGATVVSIGTTLPEVMVSTTSALSGHGQIAYGNAIGSIICNSALIAAITIAVRPGKVDPKSLRIPVLFFFVAAALYAGVAYTTGYFSRPVGLVLLALFVAYMVCNVMAEGNDIYIHEGDFRLKVTPAQAKLLKPYVGKQVTFGIRPEDVAHSSQAIDGQTIDGTVSVVEPLGSETHVFVSTSKNQVTGKIDPSVIVKVDEKISLAPNMEKAKFFDIDTELAIR